MARPPKGRDDQRSETPRCRMRPAEYLRIRRAPQWADLSLSDYARLMLLTGQVARMGRSSGQRGQTPGSKC